MNHGHIFERHQGRKLGQKMRVRDLFWKFENFRDGDDVEGPEAREVRNKMVLRTVEVGWGRKASGITIDQKALSSRFFRGGKSKSYNIQLVSASAMVSRRASMLSRTMDVADGEIKSGCVSRKIRWFEEDLPVRGIEYFGTEAIGQTLRERSNMCAEINLFLKSK